MVERKIEKAARKRPWWQRETVRLRGYSVGLAIVGILVLRECLTNEEATYVLMALAAVLGVYGVESSRSSTTPDPIVGDVVGQAERVTRWPYRSDIRADDTPADYPDDWQDDDAAGAGPKH